MSASKAQFASVKLAPAQCGADDCTGCQSIQTNEPNPILVAYRRDQDSGPVGYVVDGRRPTRLQHWIAQIETNDRVAVSIGTGVVVSSPAQITHARRVLARLANLTEGASA